MGSAGVIAAIIAVGAVVMVAGGVAVRAAMGRVRRRAGEALLARAPRAQHAAFVVRLREMVFKDPVTVMERLWEDGREEFVRTLWREVGSEVHRVKLPDELKGAGEAAELAVRPLMFKDGRAVVVVSLPKAERVGEAHLVGIALPRTAAMKEDAAQARAAVRFFVLTKRGGGERETEVCEWTGAKGEERAYGVALAAHDVGFAEVMWRTLEEAGR